MISSMLYGTPGLKYYFFIRHLRTRVTEKAEERKEFSAAHRLISDRFTCVTHSPLSHLCWTYAEKPRLRRIVSRFPPKCSRRTAGKLAQHFRIAIGDKPESFGRIVSRVLHNPCSNRRRSYSFMEHSLKRHEC